MTNSAAKNERKQPSGKKLLMLTKKPPIAAKLKTSEDK
jgi:hypothetical protein